MVSDDLELDRDLQRNMIDSRRHGKKNRKNKDLGTLGKDAVGSKDYYDEEEKVESNTSVQGGPLVIVGGSNSGKPEGSPGLR